jgi:hypothetical protein
MAHAQTSAPLLLQPAFEATIYHQTPHGSEQAPVLRPVETPIYDFNDVKIAFWPRRTPWQVFDTERVVDIDIEFDEDQHRNISNRDWLLEKAPLHRWFWLMRVDTAHAALNEALTHLCKK